MFHGIKTTLTNAPAKIYDTAKQAVDTAKNKVGSFNQRVVQPKVNAAKDQLASLKDSIKNKFEQLGHTKNTSEKDISSSSLDGNTSGKSFEEELKNIQENLLHNIPDDSLIKDLSSLAAKSRTVGELAEVLILMDTHALEPRGSQDLQKAIAGLAFAKKDTQEQLENHLLLKNLSFQNFNPGLQDAVKQGIAQKSFSEALKNLIQVEANDLIHFLENNHKALSYKLESDSYPLQNALDQNKHLSQMDIDALINIQKVFLDAKDKQGINPILTKTIDATLSQKIFNQLKKGFKDPIPEHLGKHLEAHSTQVNKEKATFQDAIKWIGAEYNNPQSKQAEIIKTPLIVMEKMRDMSMELLQLSALKSKGLEITPSMTKNLYYQIGEVEERLSFLKEVQAYQEPSISKHTNGYDPLVPLAQALVKDIEALKQRAANELGLSEQDLLEQAKAEGLAKKQEGYHSAVTDFLKTILKGHSGELLALANTDDKKAIRNLLNKALKFEGGRSFVNPFSKEGKESVSLGGDPGQIGFELLKDPDNSVRLQFVIHLDPKSEKDANKTPLVFDLKAKELQELSSLKEKLSEKKGGKYDEKIKELALLQLAAQNGKEIDSKYDLESLKNTLINQAMQEILGSRLEEEVKKATTEKKVSFTDSPQPEAGPEPTEISQPISEPANPAFYAEAKDQASQKIEAELKAYIDTHQESIEKEYGKRLIQD